MRRHSTTLPSDTHLYELEDGEGRSAVVMEHEAQDAEELSIEAAVTQTEQEAAEQRQLDTEQQHTSHSWRRDVNNQREGLQTRLETFSFFPFSF